jgi:hypothetical protein
MCASVSFVFRASVFVAKPLSIMQNMRRAVVCAAIAAWGATGVGADTCADVAASSSIEIKKRFDIGYASRFSPALCSLSSVSIANATY